jgi:hypothetical protein
MAAPGLGSRRETWGPVRPLSSDTEISPGFDDRCGEHHIPPVTPVTDRSG